MAQSMKAAPPSRPQVINCRANYCKKDITNEIHIQCAMCENFALCLQCFSVGHQEGNHHNTHDYRVIDNMKFPLFEPGWGADEELKLISAIEIVGFGNWNEVAMHVVTKTAEQCHNHYLDTYINVGTAPLPDSSNLARRLSAAQHPSEDGGGVAGPAIKDEFEAKAAAPPTAAQLQLGVGQPIKSAKAGKNKGKRGKGGKSVSLVKQQAINADRVMQNKNGGGPSDPRASLPAAVLGPEQAGYYTVRDDFEQEYDNDCEKLVAGIVFHEGDDPLMKKLKLTMLQIYNSKLSQRQHRKDMCRKLELTDTKIHELCKKDKDFKSIRDYLRPFAKYHDPKDHVALLHAYHQKLRLSHKVMELQNYRTQGLRQFKEVEQYEIDKRKREREPHAPVSSPNRPKTGLVTMQRKTSTLAAVESLPNVHLLSEREHELCSTVGLFPNQYLTLKRSFMCYSLAQGGLQLATALGLTQLPQAKVQRVHAFMLQSDWIC